MGGWERDNECERERERARERKGEILHMKTEI